MLVLINVLSERLLKTILSLIKEYKVDAVGFNFYILTMQVQM